MSPNKSLQSNHFKGSKDLDLEPIPEMVIIDWLDWLFDSQRPRPYPSPTHNSVPSRHAQTSEVATDIVAVPHSQEAINREPQHTELRLPQNTSNPALVPRGPGGSGSFQVLPTEIIQAIAWLLPIDSVVALTMCNRHLMWIVGSRHFKIWRQRHDWIEVRDVALRRLEWHVPESFYCHRCRKLHVLTRPDEHGAILSAAERFERMTSLPCIGDCECLHASGMVLVRRGWQGTGPWTRDTIFVYVSWEIPCPLCCSHVRLGFKLHRHGLTSVANAYFTHLSLKTKLCQMTRSPPHKGFAIHEPRIIRGQFFVRAQYWIFVPDSELSFPAVHRAGVCNHLRVRRDGSDKYSAALRCRFAHLKEEKDSCSQCQATVRCPDCATDVVVGIVRHDTRGSAIVITKWHAVGPKLDASERSWPHEYCDDACLCLGAKGVWQDDAPGGIQAYFESQPVVKYDAILEPNRAWDMMQNLLRKAKGDQCTVM